MPCGKGTYGNKVGRPPKKKKRSNAGKGDAPRNCFSKKFRDNYDFIKWK